MSNVIQIPKAYSFLRQPKRYKVMYGGRGAARSHSIARTLITMGMERPLRIVCAREIQKSIKDSVHELLKDLINSYGLQYFYHVKEAEIEGRNGTQFKFRGLKHNTTDLKSLEGVDILWIEEAENVSDNSYEIVIPTIRKDNSEIWISLNTKHPTDPTYSRFIAHQDDDIIARKLTYRDNPFFPEVLEKERLRLQKTDPEAYDHVWEGNFDTRYSGAVYAKWLAKINEAGRVSDKVKHDPNYPVYTAWDLGYSDETAIIFYQVGSNEIFVIDYYESNLEDIQHYCEVLYGREIKIQERELDTGEVTKWEFGEDLPEHAHRKAYNYHQHNVPHDAAYRLQAAGGRSMVTQAQKLGVLMHVMGQTSRANSREALRETIPKMWINGETARDLVSSLMHYHFEYDEDKKVFKKDEVHDWSSHGSNAAEILARSWREKGISTEDLERKRHETAFMNKRRKYNLEQQDPYRMRRK